MRIRIGVGVTILAVAGLLGAQARPSGSVWEGRKSAWLRIPPGDRDAVFRFGEEYKAYLKVARTALTSTAEVLRLARSAGFSEWTEGAAVKPGARLFVNGRDRAVMLIVVGSEPIVSGSRTIGTHHDSPHIDLKARPIYTEKDADNFALFKTIYYGGIKKYQWANRPLALLGRIDTSAGKRVDVSIGLNAGDPVFVIPDNAPHSDKLLRERKYEGRLRGRGARSGRGQRPGGVVVGFRAGARGISVGVRHPGGGPRQRRAAAGAGGQPGGRRIRPRA